MENDSWEHICTLAKDYYRRLNWHEPTEEILELIVTAVRVKYANETVLSISKNQ